MSEKFDVDVAIAGGGPVGLAAAVELSLQGVRAVVVEPRNEVDHSRPRAKTTSVRTMEHFRRWGIASQIRSAAPIPLEWSDSVALRTRLNGSEIARFDNSFAMSLRRDGRFNEPGQQIPQGIVEDVLRMAVRDRATTRLMLGWAVESFDQDETGVSVHMRGEHSQSTTIRARYLLGCDGGRSTIRDQLGIALDGAAVGRPNYNVVIRAPGLLDRVPGARAVHYWIANTESAGAMGPLDLKDTWWAGLLGVDQQTGDRHASQLVSTMIGLDAEEMPIEILSSDPWTARALLAERFDDRRVFLLGDAAHQNPPFGGHGYNTGIGDAVNLGWKLAAVVNGWAPVGLLRSYDAERRAVAQDTILDASNNTRQLSADFFHPDLEAEGEKGERARARSRDAFLESKKPEFHSLGLVLGYDYRSSPIVQSVSLRPRMPRDPVSYVPSWNPGGLLPHSWDSQGRSLYDSLGSGLTLVVRRSGDAAPFQRVAGKRKVPLTVIELEDWTGDGDAEAPRVALVRPDQHLAWVADHAADDSVAVAALDLALGDLAEARSPV